MYDHVCMMQAVASLVKNGFGWPSETGLKQQCAQRQNVHHDVWEDRPGIEDSRVGIAALCGMQSTKSGESVTTLLQHVVYRLPFPLCNTCDGVGASSIQDVHCQATAHPA